MSKKMLSKQVLKARAIFTNTESTIQNWDVAREILAECYVRAPDELLGIVQANMTELERRFEMSLHRIPIGKPAIKNKPVERTPEEIAELREKMKIWMAEKKATREEQQ